MSAKEKSTFSQFFKEDAELVQDIIYGQNGEAITEKVGKANKPVFPKMPQVNKAPENELIAYWKKLRSFFRNDMNQDGIPDDLKPIHIAPLYEKIIVGTDYPVWIAEANYNGKGEYCMSLKEVIESRMHVVGPDEKDARILKDNIDRLVHIANKLLYNHREQDFRQILEKTLQELTQILNLDGSNLESFKKDIQKLSDHLPDNGVLIPYSNHTVFDIMEAAMFATHDHLRNKLKDKIRRIHSKLLDILRLDSENSPAQQKAKDMHDTLEFADSLVNFDELSTILPESGSISIGEERKVRINHILNELDKATPILDQQAFMAIGEYLEKRKNIAWNNLFPNIETQIYRRGGGSKMVTRTFTKHIQPWTALFIAMRMGELELEDNYQADVHDDYFSHFTWRNLSIEELDNCPYFMLVADDIELFASEFHKLSITLDNNIPIKIVAIKSDNSRSDQEIVDLHTQADLGGIMLSHKNIYVAQCTSISPKELFKVFKNGLTAFAPALFNILNVDDETHTNPYLWTSASVESRDFPGFVYDGILGTPWGGRFDVSNNPQPLLEWPAHEIEIEESAGDNRKIKVAFTFADLAILNPAYHYHFMDIEPKYWTDNLIPFANYITNNKQDNIGKIPFIYTIDAEAVIHKVAVSWQVAIATQERLDFWRFLQENSGINNYHVAKASLKTKAELADKHAAAIALLKEAHAKEIELVRAEEADKVMGKLTNVLLNLDTISVSGSTAPIKAAVPDKKELKAEKPAAVAKEAKAEPKADVLAAEPYIDTPLCTSCNECINKNGKMFNYNGDKMAFIANPKAGTYRDLVEAAEACPVGIIHPGAPLNKAEVDLDDLMARAKKFN